MHGEVYNTTTQHTWASSSGHYPLFSLCGNEVSFVWGMYVGVVTLLQLLVCWSKTLSLSLSLCRTDELKRQYTGAICGLGFDPDTEDSIYDEDDIELTFDTLITQSDLKKV